MQVMPGILARAVTVSGLCLASFAPPDVAYAAGRDAFDGDWATTILCAVAPDAAKGYRWQFVSHVKGGALTGQYGIPGANSSGTLTGRIKANGDSLLQMTGMTGDSAYSIGRVAPGYHFHYTANVHFDGAGGSGRRNEARDCTLDFSKM